MRNVRKTLVTVGIAVALAVGPGVGMANAAPLQVQPTQPPSAVPPDVLPLKDLMVGVNDMVAQLTSLVPELPIPSLPV
jgi:hypothetical protein